MSYQSDTACQFRAGEPKYCLENSRHKKTGLKH